MEEEFKITYNLGTCAACGSDSINYGTLEVEGTNLWYPYVCDDCGHDGDEVYDLIYTHSD